MFPVLWPPPQWYGTHHSPDQVAHLHAICSISEPQTSTCNLLAAFESHILHTKFLVTTYVLHAYFQHIAYLLLFYKYMTNSVPINYQYATYILPLSYSSMTAMLHQPAHFPHPPNTLPI